MRDQSNPSAGEMVIHICLNSEKNPGFVSVIDECDAGLVLPYRWNVDLRHDDRPYAVSTVRRNGALTRLRMHRLITGANPGEIVDHVNRDTLDNRRCNLRKVSMLENAKNKAAQSRRSSPYKGCYPRVLKDGTRRWWSSIMADGKVYPLGTFGTPEEAARAYDRAALRIHGPYACTNVMLGLLEAES